VAKVVEAEGDGRAMAVFFAISVRGVNELREFNLAGLVDGDMLVFDLLVDVILGIFWSVGRYLFYCGFLRVFCPEYFSHFEIAVDIWEYN